MLASFENGGCVRDSRSCAGEIERQSSVSLDRFKGSGTGRSDGREIKVTVAAETAGTNVVGGGDREGYVYVVTRQRQVSGIDSVTVCIESIAIV